MKINVSIIAGLYFVCIQNGFCMDKCYPAQMAKCTDPLTLVTDNNNAIGWGSNRQDLENMCSKLMDGIACINSFSVRCFNREQRAYFHTIYAGTIQVIEDLCKNGPFQTDYLRHAPCMKRVQNEYSSCSARYQEMLQLKDTSTFSSTQSEKIENFDVGLLCCSFQEYLSCSMSAVNNTCGRDTAVFTKTFLDRMSSPLSQGHCHVYTFSSSQCSEILELVSSTTTLSSVSFSSSSSTSVTLSLALLFPVLLY